MDSRICWFIAVMFFIYVWSEVSLRIRNENLRMFWGLSLKCMVFFSVLKSLPCLPYVITSKIQFLYLNMLIYAECICLSQSCFKNHWCFNLLCDPWLMVLGFPICSYDSKWYTIYFFPSVWWIQPCMHACNSYLPIHLGNGW